jgi:uncharacterized protein
MLLSPDQPQSREVRQVILRRNSDARCRFALCATRQSSGPAPCGRSAPNSQSAMSFEIKDLHQEVAARDELLHLNNSSARETSMLTRPRFDSMISSASIATYIEPRAAFLLAFAETDDYDGGHFLWFRHRFESFLYIDRVVVAEAHRRHGLGKLLYADVIRRADQFGHKSVVCEVNVLPANPVSDKFHAALGFEETGRATTDNGAKTVRYLFRRVAHGCV